MTPQRQHRKRRRARGQCVVEGCVRKTGDTYRCDEHAEEHRAAERARYWAKREQKARAA